MFIIIIKIENPDFPRVNRDLKNLYRKAIKLDNEKERLKNTQIVLLAYREFQEPE